MSRPSDNRIHPLVAIRAVRALMRDREDSRQAFELIDALRGKTQLRQLDRFRHSEVGRAVLAERRQLLDRLNDRDKLGALPSGTLGRAYYDFMSAEHLSAGGLAMLSNMEETLPPGEDITLFRERVRDMHDLLHVVAGYGRDPLGEACVVAFSFAQTGLKGFAVIAIDAAHRIAKARPGQPIRRAVLEGYRRGRRAGWMIGADWENLLAESLEAIRARFGVVPSVYYPKILAATNAGRAADGEEASHSVA